MGADERLIVLAGGDAVYVFRADQAEIAEAQEAVIDVAYPAGETLRSRVTETQWEAASAALRRDNPEVQIVDMRSEGPHE